MLRVEHASLGIILVDHVLLGELQMQVLLPIVVLVEDLTVNGETGLVILGQLLFVCLLLFAHLF